MVRGQGHDEVKYGRKSVVQRAPFWRGLTGQQFAVEDNLVVKSARGEFVVLTHPFSAVGWATKRALELLKILLSQSSFGVT